MKKLVTEAKSGNKAALESLIMEIRDLVYNLSLKMLLFPEDAQDATQEILVRIITHLGTFKGESKFTTWVYRVATNYLLTHKGKQAKEFAMSFDEYATLIDTGQSDRVQYAENEGELALLEEEVKVSCTQGLLLCLNETQRMAYILGELLEFNSQEGAIILDMSPENFRQQLARSRERIRNFLQAKCGLANPKNPCRCTRKIDFLVNQQVINPEKLRFAHLTNRSIELIGKIKDLENSVAIYRSVPAFATPEKLVQKIKETIALIG